jgi:hypothetical protein
MERIGGKDRTSVFLSLLSWTKGLLQIFSRRSNCYGWQLQILKIWPQSFPSNRSGKAKSCMGSLVSEFCVWTWIDLSQRYTKVNMRSRYLRVVSEEQPPADRMKYIVALDHTYEPQTQVFWTQEMLYLSNHTICQTIHLRKRVTYSPSRKSLRISVLTKTGQVQFV